MVMPAVKAKQIRIYVEGGGESNRLSAPMREGFDLFFKDIKTRTSLQIIVCGTKDQTRDAFKIAMGIHPDSVNILMVDTDCLVKTGTAARATLLHGNKSWVLPELPDHHFHLMVVVMESWFLADRDALKTYYGNGFRENALPPNRQVEQVSKDDIYKGLQAATRDTTKGEYQKRKHSAGILKILDRKRVCEHAPHCQRLFEVLEANCP